MFLGYGNGGPGGTFCETPNFGRIYGVSENPTLPPPFDDFLALIVSTQCILIDYDVFFNFGDPLFFYKKK